MNFTKIIPGLDLSFRDKAEEKEYRDLRVPVIQSFFTVSFFDKNPFFLTISVVCFS